MTLPHAALAHRHEHIPHTLQTPFPTWVTAHEAADADHTTASERPTSRSSALGEMTEVLAKREGTGPQDVLVADSGALRLSDKSQLPHHDANTSSIEPGQDKRASAGDILPTVDALEEKLIQELEPHGYTNVTPLVRLLAGGADHSILSAPRAWCACTTCT